MIWKQKYRHQIILSGANSYNTWAFKSVYYRFYRIYFIHLIDVLQVKKWQFLCEGSSNQRADKYF